MAIRLSIHSLNALNSLGEYLGSEGTTVCTTGQENFISYPAIQESITGLLVMIDHQS